MWEELWGQMVWGGTTPVPTIGAVGVVLLVGILLGAGYARGRFTPRVVATSVVTLMLVVPLFAVAAGVVVPHVFSNGSIADADEVNANFSALEVDSSDQDARLTALEGDLDAGLTISYFDCIWTACVDSPRYSFCPAGRVMVGIDMPEFGGNEGSCNTSATTGPDDYRLRCCRLRTD